MHINWSTLISAQVLEIALQQVRAHPHHVASTVKSSFRLAGVRGKDSGPQSSPAEKLGTLQPKVELVQVSYLPRVARASVYYSILLI